MSGVVDVKYERRAEDYSRFLAKEFLDKGKVTGVEIWGKNWEQSEYIKSEIRTSKSSNQVDL